VGHFVKANEVPVTLDGEDIPNSEKDVVYIKPKMDIGTKNRVTDAAYTFGGPGALSQGMHFQSGAYINALLVENIIRWEGPGFEGVLCTPENILLLDEDSPLVVRVLEEIRERNPLVKEVEATERKNSSNGAGKRGTAGLTKVK
jgi:hypothetical protein